MNAASDQPCHDGFAASADPDFPLIDWKALVDYHLSVEAEEHLEAVHRLFLQTDANFMAVVDHGRAIGLCARHEIGMKLGSQYGFSLFAREPVRDHLLKESVMVTVDQPWVEVLQEVFSRSNDSFGHDIALLDGGHGLLGLISVRSLVQLQTRLLVHSINTLRQKQREISKHNRQFTDDLKMAREMQMAMLPQIPPFLVSSTPQGTRTLSIHAHYAPLGLVSGDVYEILELSATRVCVLVADVMGHGVQAALVTSMMRALIQDHRDMADDPGRFLAALNHSLCGIFQSSSLTIFASAVALMIDLAEGCLHYANAGHPSPIRLGEGTGHYIACAESANGGVLGIEAETQYATEKMPLGSRDLILLYSDGLFEIRGQDHQMLGQDGLLALAQSKAHHSAESLGRELLQDVHALAGGFEDDVCLVIVDINTHPGECATAFRHP